MPQRPLLIGPNLYTYPISHHLSSVRTSKTSYARFPFSRLFPKNKNKNKNKTKQNKTKQKKPKKVFALRKKKEEERKTERQTDRQKEKKKKKERKEGRKKEGKKERETDNIVSLGKFRYT